MLHAVAFECISFYFVLLICTKMELSTHPLLYLVESNKKGLKSMLTSYIDDTVDNQFDFLKKSILKMIQCGQIGPQQNHKVTAFGTTSPPPTQANTDQSSAQCSHEYLNDTLTRAREHLNKLPNEVSLSNTINSDSMIKQEFNDEEEINDDNVANCENCKKEICTLVRENYDNASQDDTETGENEPLETEQNLDTALENNQMNQTNSSYDIFLSPSPTNQINKKQECLQGLSITIHSRNFAPNDIFINEPIGGQNPQIDEFYDNGNDDDYHEEDSENGQLIQPNCEDCANGVCDLDHENNNNNHLNNDEPFETQNVDASQKDNQINQSMISKDIEETTENANNELEVNDKNDKLHNVRRSNEQKKKKKTRQMNKSGNRQSERSVIGQIDSSTPSSSEVRSSARKRIPKKVFGDDQLNDEKRYTNEKRKSARSNINVKKTKRIKIENADEDIDDDDDNDDQEDVTGQIKVNILKLHCTEPGCGQTVTSRALWREHMWNDHLKLPHHQLNNNARLNDRDKTEHPCIEPTCNTICTTHQSLSNHWNHYHQTGEFKCSLCPFVANLNYKVRNHFYATHASHECIHCGEKFSKMSKLKRHERMHTGERPYKCTWKKCQSGFKEIGHAVKHVRMKHFNLPKTKKEQNELNIIDSRNAHDYIHKIEHLL